MSCHLNFGWKSMLRALTINIKFKFIFELFLNFYSGYTIEKDVTIVNVVSSDKY